MSRTEPIPPRTRQSSGQVAPPMAGIPAPAPAGRTPANVERHIPGRILIVDDDPDVRAGLELLVSSEGCEVRAAADAGRALEIVRQWAPDLILLDLFLQGMDARQLLRDYAHFDEPRAPIIALTGHTTELDEELQLLGVVAVLHKPFELDELLDLTSQYVVCGQ